MRLACTVGAGWPADPSCCDGVIPTTVAFGETRGALWKCWKKRADL